MLRKLTRMTTEHSGVRILRCHINRALITNAHLLIAVRSWGPAGYVCHDHHAFNGGRPQDGNRLGHRYSWYVDPDMYASGQSDVSDIYIEDLRLCPKDGEPINKNR